MLDETNVGASDLLFFLIKFILPHKCTNLLSKTCHTYHTLHCIPFWSCRSQHISHSLFFFFVLIIIFSLSSLTFHNCCISFFSSLAVFLLVDHHRYDDGRVDDDDDDIFELFPPPPPQSYIISLPVCQYEVFDKDLIWLPTYHMTGFRPP